MEQRAALTNEQRALLQQWWAQRPHFMQHMGLMEQWLQQVQTPAEQPAAQPPAQPAAQRPFPEMAMTRAEQVHFERQSANENRLQHIACLWTWMRLCQIQQQGDHNVAFLRGVLIDGWMWVSTSKRQVQQPIGTATAEHETWYPVLISIPRHCDGTYNYNMCYVVCPGLQAQGAQVQWWVHHTRLRMRAPSPAAPQPPPPPPAGDVPPVPAPPAYAPAAADLPPPPPAELQPAVAPQPPPPPPVHPPTANDLPPPAFGGAAPDAGQAATRPDAAMSCSSDEEQMMRMHL